LVVAVAAIRRGVVLLITFVILASTVFITTNFALGDVITGETPTVFGVNLELHGSHGGETATGVVTLFPSIISELMLKDKLGANEAALQIFLDTEGVSEQNLAGWILTAELIGVAAFPDNACCDGGVDETDRPGANNAVGGGLGSIHDLLLG